MCYEPKGERISLNAVSGHIRPFPGNVLIVRCIGMVLTLVLESDLELIDHLSSPTHLLTFAFQHNVSTIPVRFIIKTFPGKAL